MFVLGRPPSASGLRPWAVNGAGEKFRSLYAVTVWRGDRGPTTKKSAVEPRLAGETGPQESAKVMVTTGRSPATKNEPFVGLETATVAVRPLDCGRQLAGPPSGPAGPCGP